MTFVGLRLDGQRGLLVKVVGGTRGVLREVAKNGTQTDSKPRDAVGIGGPPTKLPRVGQPVSA